MGSRNGQAALYMWYSLRKKGVDGIKAEVLHCMETATYLRDAITAAGLTCRLNDLSCTVVLGAHAASLGCTPFFFFFARHASFKHSRCDQLRAAADDAVL
eukprot:SAG11_NODE_10679_length_812_cov_1.572230_1_plen_100_part_00